MIPTSKKSETKIREKKLIQCHLKFEYQEQSIYFKAENCEEQMLDNINERKIRERNIIALPVYCCALPLLYYPSQKTQCHVCGDRIFHPCSTMRA